MKFLKNLCCGKCIRRAKIAKLREIISLLINLLVQCIIKSINRKTSIVITKEKNLSIKWRYIILELIHWYCASKLYVTAACNLNYEHCCQST